MAQCYPDSSASWCLIDLNNSDFLRINMIMGADPDTVILGQTYQRIEEYNMDSFSENVELVNRDYVRSAPDGKGYVMLLDSMQEYLAADINAAAGDTVRDVLIKEGFGAQPFPSYFLWDVVVDSIRTLENNGVIVRRMFIHLAGFQPGPQSQVYFNFWQAGIGNATGALFNSYISLGFFELMCLRVQDTFVYNRETAVPYLPGVPCECSILPVGIEDRTSEQVSIGPNPSTGKFTFSTEQPMSIRVYDAFGRMVLRTVGKSVDLSSEPEGAYVAMFPSSASGNNASGNGNQVVRLVVAR